MSWHSPCSLSAALLPEPKTKTLLIKSNVKEALATDRRRARRNAAATALAATAAACEHRRAAIPIISRRTSTVECAVLPAAGGREPQNRVIARVRERNAALCAPFPHAGAAGERSREGARLLANDSSRRSELLDELHWIESCCQRETKSSKGQKAKCEKHEAHRDCLASCFSKQFFVEPR